MQALHTYIYICYMHCPWFLSGRNEQRVIRSGDFLSAEQVREKTNSKEKSLFFSYLQSHDQKYLFWHSDIKEIAWKLQKQWLLIWARSLLVQEIGGVHSISFVNQREDFKKK